MNLLVDKLYWKAVSLKVLFLALFLVIGKEFVSRIYDIIIVLQGVGSVLPGYQNVDDLNYQEVESLRSIVSNINASLNDLILFSILFGAVIFVLYVVFESLIWNLIYNKKIKDYKRYVFKFTILSVILFIFMVPILFMILAYSRTFLISYMFDGEFLSGLFGRTLLMFMLLGLVVYLIDSGYVYLNKYKLLRSIREMFRFKSFYLYFILLGVFLVVFFIIRGGLATSTHTISLIAQGILISVVVIWYQFYFVEKLGGS